MNRTFYLVTLFATLLIGCKKEEQNPKNTLPLSGSQSNLIEVTHHYDYYGTTFSVRFVFNEYNEVVIREGDVALYDRIMENEINSIKAFKIDRIMKEGKEMDIRIFNSEEELNRIYEQEIPELSGSDRCTDWLSQPGSAEFYFFEHVDYNQEFHFLRVTNASYFQDQWLDQANDQISSFWVGPTQYPTNDRARLDVFMGSCFSGNIYSFTAPHPNLHWANPNLGDQISSLKGWSL